MAKLILVRHGQSAWNLENRFTGDVDVELTPAGEEEARKAGLLLYEYHFQTAYTSVLRRAIHTLEIILRENRSPDVPVVRDAALNERRYGELQGLNKKETEDKFGSEQVLVWRRSFETRPPGGESLKDTYDRVIPYYLNTIQPGLENNGNILIVAHGNSLRALMMYLEQISITDIAGVNLATGAPRQYEFDDALRPVKIGYLQ